LLKSRGFVVYLETTVDEQMKRLARDRKRPLLAAPDRRERLIQLAAQRGPLYREIADFTVAPGHGNSVPQAAQRLANSLRERWQRATSDEHFAA